MRSGAATASRVARRGLSRPAMPVPLEPNRESSAMRSRRSARAPARSRPSFTVRPRSSRRLSARSRRRDQLVRDGGRPRLNGEALMPSSESSARWRSIFNELPSSAGVGCDASQSDSVAPSRRDQGAPQFALSRRGPAVSRSGGEQCEGGVDGVLGSDAGAVAACNFARSPFGPRCAARRALPATSERSARSAAALASLQRPLPIFRSTRSFASDRRNDISAGTCFCSSAKRPSASNRRKASRLAETASTSAASRHRCDRMPYSIPQPPRRGEPDVPRKSR